MTKTAAETKTSSAKNTSDNRADVNDIAMPKLNEEDIETAQELIHISSDIFAGLSKYQQEIMSFYSKRIIEDLELQQKLFSCKSFNEIIDLQRSFLEKSSQQYSEEVGKLMKLGRHIVPTELTGLEDQISQ